MSDGLTANYSWVMPEVGGSPDTWGTKLNVTTAAIDAQVKLNQTAAAAAQAAATAGAAVAAAALPAASYTALDVKAKLLTVDGAGSNIDADLLDSQQGAFYQNSANQNAGTLPVARLHGSVLRNGYNSAVVTVSPAAPSGGADGDLWLRV